MAKQKEIEKTHVRDNKNLTVEELYDTIREIFFRDENKKPRDIVLARFCITNGWTYDNPLPKLCNDPECGSCRMFDEALKEAASEFTTKGWENGAVPYEAVPYETEIYGIKFTILPSPPYKMPDDEE